MFSYLPLSSMTYKTFSSRVNETEKPFKDSLQSWTKYWRQIHKIKRNRFFYGMFSVDFLQFLPRYVKSWLWGGRLGTRHQTQAFQGFS